jgi:Fuc2NAc and GlcNAc transferase
MWVIGLGGTFITLIGWLDDCYSLSSGFRFASHFLAALWAVYWLSTPDSPIIWNGIWVVGIAWAINFYNFMDGSDGLAGSEAVIVGFAGSYIAARCGFPAEALIAVSVAGASLGFLCWNFPPAKIFLGDSGSGFLGYVFGCLSASAGWSFHGGFGTWAILLFLFWFDATFTLFRRIINRERFWEAHRSHIYQRAIQAGYTHRQVLFGFLLGNAVLAGLAAKVSF